MTALRIRAPLMLLAATLLFGCAGQYQPLAYCYKGVLLARDTGDRFDRFLATEVGRKDAECRANPAVGMAIAYYAAKCRSLETEKTQAEFVQCMGANLGPLMAYRSCVRRFRELAIKWLRLARPSINTGLRTTHAGCETAFQVVEGTKDGKKLDVEAVVKIIGVPICAVLKVIAEWRPLLGDKLKPFEAPLLGITGLVCK